jgi:hypothetical protein
MFQPTKSGGRFFSTASDVVLGDMGAATGERRSSGATLFEDFEAPKIIFAPACLVLDHAA